MIEKGFLKTIIDPDSPYTLSEPDEVKRRLAMLRLPHIAPLVAYTQKITARLGDNYQIPYFDPYDGGIHAKVLFLLEAPGRKAVEALGVSIGSGFISRNNPDPSAKNMCNLLKAAGIPRTDTLLWNIVPWYVGSNSKIRAVKKSDIETALSFFKELIDFLPNLKAIVLVGRKAQSAKSQLAHLASTRFFESYHPSLQVINRSPERYNEILGTFKNIGAFLKNGD